MGWAVGLSKPSPETPSPIPQTVKPSVAVMSEVRIILRLLGMDEGKIEVETR